MSRILERISKMKPLFEQIKEDSHTGAMNLLLVAGIISTLLYLKSSLILAQGSCPAPSVPAGSHVQDGSHDNSWGAHADHDNCHCHSHHSGWNAFPSHTAHGSTI